MTFNKEVAALAILRQFLSNPLDLVVVKALSNTSVGTLLQSHLVIEPDMRVVVFEVMDKKQGKPLAYTAQPATYGLLLATVLAGQSIISNRNKKEGGKPYLKVCAKTDTKAGTVFARFITSATAGEIVRYVDGDVCNLRHRNIREPIGKPRTQVDENREAYGVLGTMASKAIETDDAVFPGSPEDKAMAAFSLLKEAARRVHEERYESLRIATVAA